MKCLRVFCICSAISLICSFPCFALEDSSFEVYSTDPVLDDDVWVENVDTSKVQVVYDEDGAYLTGLFSEEDDFDVYAYDEILDDPSYFVLPARLRAALPVIGDDPPTNPLFYGSCWVTGYDSNLGNVTIYFPLSAKNDTWGVDGNGYLYNITSGSVSGYLSGVYNNSVSASGFAYPRYREGSGSNYSYIDLHLIPSNSNMEIATAMEPAQNVTQLLPFVYVAMLGVIIVCFMKRF